MPRKIVTRCWFIPSHQQHKETDAKPFTLAHLFTEIFTFIFVLFLWKSVLARSSADIYRTISCSLFVCVCVWKYSMTSDFSLLFAIKESIERIKQKRNQTERISTCGEKWQTCKTMCRRNKNGLVFAWNTENQCCLANKYMISTRFF